MTDEEIRNTAVSVYNATPCQPGGYWEDDRDDAIEAVYRAGMEAGRAEAAAKPKRRKSATVDADPKATVSVADMMRHGVHPLAAEDWLRVRRQHRAPLTRSAWDSTMREAEAAGMTIGAVVQMCAERSWRGFRAEYVAKGAPSGPGRGPQAGRMDRQLETAALMTGAARSAPTDMGEIYDVGQQRIAGR